MSDRNSFLPQQFMKIARSLSDGEIMLLSAVWEMDKTHEGDYEKHYGAAKWVLDVTDASVMQHVELVEISEEELMNKKLLTPRLHGDRSGVKANPHNRLSDLGYEFCQFIEKYDE